jgi:hypothetical protein
MTEAGPTRLPEVPPLRCIAVCLALVIAACTGPYPSDLLRRPVVPDYPTAGRTYLLFDPGQGFRVEHFADGGRAYLWAPGGAVVPGVWELRDVPASRNTEFLMRAARQLCLRFGHRAAAVSSFGPNDWDCRPRIRVADGAVAVAEGDLFGLARAREPPWPLERCRPPGAFTLLREAGC